MVNQTVEKDRFNSNGKTEALSTNREIMPVAGQSRNGTKDTAESKSYAVCRDAVTNFSTV